MHTIGSSASRPGWGSAPLRWLERATHCVASHRPLRGASGGSAFAHTLHLPAPAPTPVARTLDGGPQLGPREVTILFADLHNYTHFCDEHGVDEVFAMVSCYAGAASQIVRRYGGWVVEVHGDGILSVFGAPEALVGKERWAVRAACELIDAVEPMLAAEAGPGPDALSMSVGIATGDAYIGTIHTSGCCVWSAIGRTTTLAARLQSLGGAIGAQIVIDRTTWERCGSEGAGFDAHEKTPIRGLRSEVDVYASVSRVPRAFDRRATALPAIERARAPLVLEGSARADGRAGGAAP